jgi:4-hydroxy-tetrahydrodipicolinate synthase
MFSGTYTALVTPFRSDAFDDAAFAALIEAQIAGGVTGIVPVGTTGESPTVTHQEHLHVIRRAIEIAAGRCQVIAGTGSNSTAEAVAMTTEAARLGADAALLVAPYYNKPSQEGLFRHYARIAQSSPLPLMLYSIPGRCGIEIGVETTRRLADAFPTIVAIKEAGGSLERVSALRQALPDRFTILSGDDSLTLPFIAAGARGVVSVASNLIPREVAALVRDALDGNFTSARARHERLYPLFKILFIEPNPVPVKTALAEQKRMTSEVRLPLCEMAETNRTHLLATLRQLELIS